MYHTGSQESPIHASPQKPFQTPTIAARKRNARDVLKQATDPQLVFTKHVTTQLRLGKNGGMNKRNNKLHPCQTPVCSYPWRSSELDSPFGIAAASSETQERTKFPSRVFETIVLDLNEIISGFTFTDAIPNTQSMIFLQEMHSPSYSVDGAAGVSRRAIGEGHQ
jgi:hypothetical protein